MCFAAPHRELEEVVGLALPKTTGVGLRQLRRWAMSSLPPQHLPQVLTRLSTLIALTY